MALTITMREKHEVKIGAVVYQVARVVNGLEFSLVSGGQKFAINCTNWTQLQEGVKVQAGIPRNIKGRLVRLVIDADRSVPVFLIKEKE